MKKFFELLFLKCVYSSGNSKIINQFLPELENIKGIDACTELVQRIDPYIAPSRIKSAKEKALKSYYSILDDPSIQVTTILDDDYPKRLNDLRYRRPVILFARGNVDLLRSDTLSVVGTRHPSLYSEAVEKRIVKNVIEHSGRTIVSGLALGCDRIAHETALYFKANTMAVLPSGLNVITPAKHKPLAKAILDSNGCIISEYEPNSKARNNTYVERDSIMAALGDGTFVMECAVKSGTMHTVDAAVDMQRKIACFMKKDAPADEYSGNRYMLEEYEAEAIYDTNELQKYLDTLPKDIDKKTEGK